MLEGLFTDREPKSAQKVIQSTTQFNKFANNTYNSTKRKNHTTAKKRQSQNSSLSPIKQSIHSYQIDYN